MKQAFLDRDRHRSAPAGLDGSLPVPRQTLFAHLLAVLVAALVMAAAPAGVQAQSTYRISGSVVRASDAAPVADVHVFVRGTDRATVSRQDGTFELDSVPAGNRVIVTRSLAYDGLALRINVQGDITNLVLRLDERFIEIPEIVVERVTMTGGQSGIRGLPGSAHYVSAAQLADVGFPDPHRVLSLVPGVVVSEEDGYGLRPNIGLRGTGSERSSKITVMEDGVLAAPAPYAAPAAYYFPTVGRMQGVEVRKGSSQIKYGPYTTGGAINFISTQIPNTLAGSVSASAGTNLGREAHVVVGNSLDRFGFLVETYQLGANGFKELDTGGDTGFAKEDYIGKLRINSRPDARRFQSLTLKAGDYSETSDETYLGLTDADFYVRPLRRYAASQLDELVVDQRQLSARHFIKFTDEVDLTTTAYHSKVDRNWYKLDRVDAGNGAVSITNILNDPGKHGAELAVTRADEGASADNALFVKANNRAYYSQGVQIVGGYRHLGSRFTHDLELGFRLHEDAVDRFQWVDVYRLVGLNLELADAGIPGTDSNRIERARAASSYAQYRARAGSLTIMPGIRYEHVANTRQDYGTSDPDRTGVDLVTNANKVDVLLPGLGVEYSVTAALLAFAGVHRGFAPPGSKEGTRPEESISYEVGARFDDGTFSFDAAAFLNEYSNLLGRDLAAVGGDGSGDLFNGGRARVSGIEFSGQAKLASIVDRVDAVVRASYSFTEAAFRSSFESEFEAWGTVTSGDDLPYLPSHQGSFGLQLERSRVQASLSGLFAGAMRTTPGRGEAAANDRIGRHLTLDIGTSVDVRRSLRLYARVVNVTNETYVAARRPAGLRPGLPRHLMVGLRTSF